MSKLIIIIIMICPHCKGIKALPVIDSISSVFKTRQNMHVDPIDSLPYEL